MDVWLEYSDGRKFNRSLGADYPVSQGRKLWGPNLNFELQFEGSESVDIYIRTRHKGFFDVKSSVAPYDEMAADNMQNFGFDMLFFGLLIALIIYHALFFLGGRDLTYFFYSLYLFATLTLFLFVEGYTFLIFDGVSKYVFPLSQLTVIFMVLSSVWFMSYFLRISRNIKYGKYITYLVTGLGIGWILMRAFVDSAVWIGGAMVMLVVSSVYIFIASGFLSLLKKTMFSLYFFIGWSVWILWLIYIALGVLNLYQFSLAETLPILKLSLVFQFLFFAWLLSVRISIQRNKQQLAEAQNNAKSELLARVSHEMRTPLNGILGISNMLRDHVKDEEGKKLNDVLYNSGQALVSVVNDLLEISRLNNKSIKVSAEEVEQELMISEVWQFFKLQIEEKGIKTECIKSEKLPEYIKIDQHRVKQVLTNLLGNSLKFTEQGKITLNIDVDNNNLLLSVFDTGRGIEASHLSKVFEPFEQVVTGKDELKTGTGLGLHITSMLVKNLGGTIGVESEIGVGSCFFVSLPFVPIQSLSKKHIEKSPSIGSLRVLVAEDNSVNFLVLKNMLNKMGHQITHQNNGKLAFEYYQQHHQSIDVILMDCEMPVMDGYEATQQIRSFEKANSLSRTPIVAVTAHVYEEHFEKIEQSGMDAQVNKPFSENEIKDILGACCQHQVSD